MKSKTVIHILAVIATIASAANLLVALSLLLGSCTDDNGLGNDGTDGNDPATTALLTPRDISYSPPVLGGVPRAAGGGSPTTVSATTRAVYEELGVGTSQQPNAIITAFEANDALTLDYSFSPADANANADPDGSPDADSYPYHATLTRQANGATPLWQISTKDAANNPLRPNADTHHGESWAYARARLTYEPLKTPGGGATAELIPGTTDATPTGYFYMGGTDPITNIATRMYYDRLVATTAITSGSGSLRIVTDLNDPNLGQFSATLQHAGAMLRLKPDDIFIDPAFVEGYTADGLSLMATVRPAGGSADGTDNYTLAFSRVTAVSGSTPGTTATPAVGTLQALLPAGATVLAFQAVLTKKNGNDDVVSTTTFPLSTTPITVAANHRYPMTLALTPTKAEVNFAKAEGELGFGEEEEEIKSDLIEGRDYNEVKDATDKVTGWEVHSAAGLKGFAALVNKGGNNLKLNCTLTADIDLSLLPKDDTGSNWTPIGDSSNPYQGIFDGGGHTVSGLVINRPDEGYQGFFGRIGKDGSPATVKNLTVEGTVTGRLNTGGIVGYSTSSSTITNCTNKGSVKGTSYTGGVAGYNYYSTITNCTNKGSVKGTGYTGGVAGYNNNSSTITNCINTGKVEGADSTGGVAGYNNNSSTITACTNTGSVTGTGNDTGGVVGENYSSSTITACYNTGSVTSTGYYIGGVAGSNYSTITACYSTGSVTGTDIYGGVAGLNTAVLTTCYWQTFGPSGSRPTLGIGEDYDNIIPSISSAYATDGTPSWFAPATAGDTDTTPAAKLNEAIDKWNGALGTDAADQKKLCPYRFVKNTAYSEALSAAGADKDYDTNVPPLLLEIPTEPTPP